MMKLNVFILTLLCCFMIKTCLTTVDYDYEYFDIKLDDVLVPVSYGSGTVYLCQEYELPLDNNFNYDLVKFEILTNDDLMVHHMLLFACADVHNVEPSQPHLCAASNVSNLCLNWVSQWSIGMPRTIEPLADTGFKVGKDYFKKLHLQIHLHTMIDIDIDSQIEHSGFRIYYTKESRKYNIGNVQIGQEDIEIPPLSDEVVVEGTCSNSCTKELFEQSNVYKIYLTRIYLHMHGLGTRGELIHKYIDEKTGEKNEVIIAQDLNYEYERPGVFDFKNPIEIKASDELVMKCYYNSKDGDRERHQTIKWGEGAYAEMCYAFVSYFPRLINFNKCTQYKDGDTCFYNPDI